MYEKCPATMQMIRMILKDGYFDDIPYPCTVIRYNEEEGCIYLLTEEKLSSFSLDGIYECRIETEKGVTACTGILRERYWNKLGNVMKFRIQNGFYKNPVN